MATVNLEDFKPNSNKSKEEEPKKEIQQVTQGKVIRKKKTVGQKFADVFLSEDIESVKGYVVFDVIVPAIKDAIFETIKGSIEMLFYGGYSAPRKTKREGGKTYVQYGSYYKSDNNRSNRTGVTDRGSRSDYTNLIFDSRAEAEEVLGNLQDIVASEFEQATVADLYELAGITSSFTDNKWGWLDLRGANVKRVREGYQLNLPKPILLD